MSEGGGSANLENVYGILILPPFGERTHTLSLPCSQPCRENLSCRLRIGWPDHLPKGTFSVSDATHCLTGGWPEP